VNEPEPQPEPQPDNSSAALGRFAEELIALLRGDLNEVMFEGNLWQLVMIRRLNLAKSV
jgi:hypothetical protein